MKLPLEVLSELGAEALILTNAAGSLRADMPTGSIMLLNDHINFSGLNPLIGEPSDRRFVPMTDAHDPDLRAALQAAAKDAGVDMSEGVYAWYSGPSFETPAEIRAIRTLGADAVGMSTVPEVIVAVHGGMCVLGISIITDQCLPDALEPASVEKIIAVASRAEPNLTALVCGVLERL
jgi:purine-nucleoside phosphorylase